MKIADNASIDDNTHGGGEIPLCTGLTPDALPEVQEPVLTENSQTGIPTRKALSGSTLKTIKGKPKEVLGNGLQRYKISYSFEIVVKSRKRMLLCF